MKTSTWQTATLVIALLGTVSFAEAQRSGRGNREAMIKKYDADGDGKLSEAERTTMREEMMKKRGGKDNEKGRGGERPSPEQLIKKYDKDGSGELSASELRQLIRDQIERMQDRGGPGGEGFQGRRGSQGGPGGNREAMLKKYDTDGDGQLNDDERAALREDMKNRRNN